MNVDEIVAWVSDTYHLSTTVFSFSSNQTMEEQARLIHNCAVVICPHGAGNVNWVFLRPGAAVVEVNIWHATTQLGYFKPLARDLSLSYAEYVPSFEQTVQRPFCHNIMWESLTPKQCSAIELCAHCIKKQNMMVPVKYLECTIGVFVRLNAVRSCLPILLRYCPRKHDTTTTGITLRYWQGTGD